MTAEPNACGRLPQVRLESDARTCTVVVTAGWNLGAYLRRNRMKFSVFMGLFLVLLLVWVGAFFVYHIANVAIHLLLVFAVIALALHFLWDPSKKEKAEKVDLSHPR